MIEFQKIHHVSLNVRDLQKAAQFYKDVLQFTEITRPPLKSKGIWFSIGDSGQQLHLIEYEGQALRQRGIDSSDGHFAIWVKSHKATVEWLEQAGLVYDARPDSAVGFSQIYITDIDHNIIEFDAPYEE